MTNSLASVVFALWLSIHVFASDEPKKDLNPANSLFEAGAFSCKLLIAGAPIIHDEYSPILVAQMPDCIAEKIYASAGRAAARIFGASLEAECDSRKAAEEAAAATTEGEFLREKLRSSYDRVWWGAVQAHLDQVALGPYQAKQFRDQLDGKSPIEQVIIVFSPLPELQPKIAQFLKSPRFAHIPRLLSASHGQTASQEFLSQMTKLRYSAYRAKGMSPLAGKNTQLVIHVMGESENLLGNFIQEDVMSWVNSEKFNRVIIRVYPNYGYSCVGGREGVMDLSLYSDKNKHLHKRISERQRRGPSNRVVSFEIDHIE